MYVQNGGLFVACSPTRPACQARVASNVCVTSSAESTLVPIVSVNCIGVALLVTRSGTTLGAPNLPPISQSSSTARFFRSGPSLPVVAHRDPVRATIAAVFHLVKAGRAKDRMTGRADCGRVRVPLIEPDHPDKRVPERGQPIARNDFGSPFVGNHADAARPRHRDFGLDAVLERLPDLSDGCASDPVEYAAVDAEPELQGELVVGRLAGLV